VAVVLSTAMVLIVAAVVVIIGVARILITNLGVTAFATIATTRVRVIAVAVVVTARIAAAATMIIARVATAVARMPDRVLTIVMIGRMPGMMRRSRRRRIGRSCTGWRMFVAAMLPRRIRTAAKPDGNTVAVVIAGVRRRRRK
jgi:hypothetical protein